MRELSELCQLITDAINGDSVLFVAWRRDGSVLTANRPFSLLTGYTLQEIGDQRWPGDFCTEETSGRITRAMEGLDRGRTSHRSDEELIRKNGERLPVEVYVHKYVGTGEEANTYFSFITDVTERNRREQELKAARDQASLYLDLICHDINNLNQVGLGYIEIALESVDGRDELREPLIKIQESLKGSAMLIDTIRKVQRAGYPGATENQVDLCQVLGELKVRYERVPGREITISYTPEKQCYVRGNELIRDIFSNLLDNAVQHSPPDRPLHVNIDLSVEEEQGSSYYKVAVEDNGPGLCGVNIDEFFAGARRGTIRAKGKGLGLFIVKMMTNNFHGKVWAEDRVYGDCSKGARFIVMLPVASRESEAAGQRAEV